MKRFLCLTLILCIFLSGCQPLGDRMKDPVSFYYVRADYQEDLEDVIVSEEREASGHLGDLSYLMALYLMGPVDENLVSPIPRGTRIHLDEANASSICLSLSETVTPMTDAEFSLACACLSLTCMELTGAEKVTITSGSRSITMTPDNLILFDDNIAAAVEETQ